MSYADPSFVNPCPDLTADEYAELKAKIEKQGFLPAYPVIISAGPARAGEIVDGFHRTKICAELGIEPCVVEIPFETDAEFELEQIDANLTRRQLSKDQTIRLRVRRTDITTAIAAAAEARMLSGKALDPTSNLTEGSRSDRETLTQNAKAAGVSKNTYKHHVEVIQSGDTFLNAELKAGRSTDSIYNKLIELQAAEKELGTKFEGGYSEFMQRKAELDVLSHQSQLEDDLDDRTIDRTDHAPSAHQILERAAGDVMRLLTEAESILRKQSVEAKNLADLRSRPHTFKGVARRLNEFLGEIEELI